MIAQSNFIEHTRNAAVNLLIVEDDLNLGFLLVDFLEDEGYSAKLCRDGASGLEQFRKNRYDLCILDVMMPEMDGFELARQLRLEDSEARFVFLTAKAMKADKIAGYDLGAEDYITKPFDQDELGCKIRAILKRCANADQASNIPESYAIGQYVFYVHRQELSYPGAEPIRLTEKESMVLAQLCANKNRILRRDEAVTRIYGKSDYFLGRSFDVFISRLRKHLNRDSSVEIQNVYRVGFILSVEEPYN